VCIYLLEDGGRRRWQFRKWKQRRNESSAAIAGNAAAKFRYYTIRVVSHRLQTKIHPEKGAP